MASLADMDEYNAFERERFARTYAKTIDSISEPLTKEEKDADRAAAFSGFQFRGCPYNCYYVHVTFQPDEITKIVHKEFPMIPKLYNNMVCAVPTSDSTKHIFVLRF